MAGWNDFLTERDKQHIAMWGKKELDGFGRRPALLVVDMFYAALGHERKPILESIRYWPMSCGLDGWEAVDRTVGLIEAARANSVPVIYVRALPGFPNDWFRRSRGLDRTPIEKRKLANEIVAELAPQPGELIIEKTSASAFAGTPLVYHLRAIGTDTLIVCGETTSGCVRAAVVDGVTLRYRIGIVGECCFDRTQSSHWINLFDMHQKYGDVIDVKTATTYFSSINHDRQSQT